MTTLQLLSTILIVAANLVVGQLIERTRTLAGKARPWILLSALMLSVASVLMFIVPFADRTARMVWIAIAYNAYYAVGFPIYNTANSTLVPVSTRNSKQRSTLASLTNIASLGVMGVGSMIFPTLVSDGPERGPAPLVRCHAGCGDLYGADDPSAVPVHAGARDRGISRRGKGRKSSASLGEQVKAVTSEKSWWLAMLFYVAFQWGGAMKNGSMTFLPVGAG